MASSIKSFLRSCIGLVSPKRGNKKVNLCFSSNSSRVLSTAFSYRTNLSVPSTVSITGVGTGGCGTGSGGKSGSGGLVVVAYQALAIIYIGAPEYLRLVGMSSV